MFVIDRIRRDRPHGRKRLYALARDRRGVAYVEFAMSLPVLLGLSLYGLETANFILANLRISQMAAVTADTASRGANQITEIDVNELMTGAKMIGSGIKFGANGRIILTDLERSTVNPSKQWIRWQRCTGAKNVASSYGTPNAEATSSMTAMGPSGNQIAAMAGSAVMFVEVVYDYQPLITETILGPQTIRYTSAFNVRQRTDYTIASAGLSNSQKALCSTFSA